MTLSKKAMTGLEHCINGEDCTGCIYRDECMESYDVKPMLIDVRCYIKQLEAQIAKEMNVSSWISAKDMLPDNQCLAVVYSDKTCYLALWNGAD